MNALNIIKVSRHGKDNVCNAMLKELFRLFLEVVDEHGVQLRRGERSFFVTHLDDKARDVVSLDILDGEGPSPYVLLRELVVKAQTEDTLELEKAARLSLLVQSSSTIKHIRVGHIYHRGSRISIICIQNYRLITLPHRAAAIARSQIKSNSIVDICSTHLSNEIITE